MSALVVAPKTDPFVFKLEGYVDILCMMNVVFFELALGRQFAMTSRERVATQF